MGDGGGSSLASGAGPFWAGKRTPRPTAPLIKRSRSGSRKPPATKEPRERELRHTNFRAVWLGGSPVWGPSGIWMLSAGTVAVPSQMAWSTWPAGRGCPQPVSQPEPVAKSCQVYDGAADDSQQPPSKCPRLPEPRLQPASAHDAGRGVRPAPLRTPLRALCGVGGGRGPGLHPSVSAERGQQQGREPQKKLFGSSGPSRPPWPLEPGDGDP